MKDLVGMTLLELQDELSEYPKFRSKQIFEWIHKHNVESVDQMKNVPAALRQKLEQEYSFTNVRVIHELESSIDGTSKALFELPDKSIVEGVVLSYSYGKTFCLSSQVGCKRGCSFCASTKDGLYRNLQASEMLQMFYLMRKKHPELKRIVFMGSGEPLDNLQEVLRFIELINDPNGLHISQRNITISTCGVASRIRELAEYELASTLTISLHNAIQSERVELMPVAKKYDLDELFVAVDEYLKKTNRRVSFEYTLIEGENDSEKHVQALKRYFQGKNYHLNLIALNEIEKSNHKRPSRQSLKTFARKLEDSGINVTIRRELAQDIEGSCGQLKNQFVRKNGRPE